MVIKPVFPTRWKLLKLFAVCQIAVPCLNTYKPNEMLRHDVGGILLQILNGSIIIYFDVDKQINASLDEVLESLKVRILIFDDELSEAFCWLLRIGTYADLIFNY